MAAARDNKSLDNNFRDEAPIAFSRRIRTRVVQDINKTETTDSTRRAAVAKLDRHVSEVVVKEITTDGTISEIETVGYCPTREDADGDVQGWRLVRMPKSRYMLLLRETTDILFAK
jgi:hypothetical protein